MFEEGALEKHVRGCHRPEWPDPRRCYATHTLSNLWPDANKWRRATPREWPAEGSGSQLAAAVPHALRQLSVHPCPASSTKLDGKPISAGYRVQARPLWSFEIQRMFVGKSGVEEWLG